MDRRQFMKRGAGAAAGAALSQTIAGHITRAAERGRRPNILLFAADDTGWADVGFHGSQINTRHWTDSRVKAPNWSSSTLIRSVRRHAHHS